MDTRTPKGESKTPTPLTDEFVRLMYERHKRENLDDFMHYMDASGELAKHASSLEIALAAAKAELNHSKNCTAMMQQKAEAAEARAREAAIQEIRRIQSYHRNPDVVVVLDDCIEAILALDRTKINAALARGKQEKEKP